MPERPQGDLQVEPDRPVGDVEDIPVHAAAEHLGGQNLSAQPQALRQTRDARFHEIAGPIAAGLPAELLVVSQAMFDDWSELPGTVYFDALREGQTLYDAA